MRIIWATTGLMCFLVGCAPVRDEGEVPLSETKKALSASVLAYPRVAVSSLNVKKVSLTQLKPISSDAGNMNGRHYLIQEDNPSQDLVLSLPISQIVEYGIRTVGFRNIRIIGGFVRPLEGSSAFKFDELHNNSHVYLEGLRIDMGRTTGYRMRHEADGIDVTSQDGHKAGYVTLQNLRIENVKGSHSGWHGDVFQLMAGALGMLRVYNLTATGNYQIFHLASVSTRLERTYFTRVNARYNGTPADANRPWLFMFKSQCSDNYALHTLREVYMRPRTGMSVARNHVHPSSAQTSCGALDNGTETSFRLQREGTNLTPSSLRSGLSAAVMVDGQIRHGDPAEGDFVPASSVGLNY